MFESQQNKTLNVEFENQKDLFLSVETANYNQIRKDSAQKQDYLICVSTSGCVRAQSSIVSIPQQGRLDYHTQPKSQVLNIDETFSWFIRPGLIYLKDLCFFPEMYVSRHFLPFSVQFTLFLP